MTSSPFSVLTTTRTRRRLLAGLAVLALMATAGFVYLVTRAGAPPDAHGSARPQRRGVSRTAGSQSC